MENQELTNAYNGAASTGYKGSIQDFTKLISTNEKAFSTVFEHSDFKDKSQFASAVGITMPSITTQASAVATPTEEVKKKDEAVPSSNVTPSSSSSTQSQSSTQKAHEIYTKLYTRLKNNPETADKAETLAKLMTAQASVEAGEDFNSRLARESNNYSGIKFFGQKDSTASKIKSPSSEQGGAIPYAHYNSMDEWADAYMNLMKGRYKETFDSKSATDFAYALKKHGYYEAPEEAYRSELDRRMHLYGLMNMTPEQVSQSAKKVVSQKAAPKQDSFFNTALNTVTPDLIGSEQEEVTSKLNYNLGGYGFKFEATGGSMADAMKVTAPNGNTIDIDLDPFTAAGESEESAKLKAFIAANKPQQTAIEKIDANYKKAKTKFVSEQDMKNTIASYQSEVDAFKKSVIAFSNNQDKMAPEQVEAERKRLIAQEQVIANKGKELDKSVGDYTAVLGEQGGFWGAVGNSLLGGAGNVLAGVAEMSEALTFAVMPLEANVGSKEYRTVFELAAKQKGVNVPANMDNAQFKSWSSSLKNKDDIEGLASDYAKKRKLYGEHKAEVNPYSTAATQELNKKGEADIAREGIVESFGTKNVTKQYLESSNRSWVEKALFGAASSLPAMLGGAYRVPLFFAQGFDMVNKEMSDNPAFANVTENEKLAISVPLGIVSAVLEEVGARNVLNSSSLVTGLTMKALGKATTDMTAKTFEDLVRTEVKSAIARGAITLATSGAAEAETGFTQQLTEDGIKKIYNEIKGKEMFKDVPNDIKGFLGKAAESARAEAVGGFVFGSINSGVAAYSKQDYAMMDDASFNTLLHASRDQNIVNAYMSNVDAQVSRGDMTPQEGQRAKDNYQNVINTLNSIPDNISDESKKKAMSILARRNELMKRIEGKDPNLVKDELETIKRLNGELSTMPRTKYVLNGKEMTREDFLHEVDAMDEEARSKMTATVENDDKTSQALAELMKVELPKQGKIEFIDGQHKTQEQNAIQEPSTTESVLRTEQPEMGLQEVGEGNAQEQTTPEEVKPQEEIKVSEEKLKGLPEGVTTNTSVEISDGLELPVKGNEAFISRTYDEIKAKPEGERSELENKALNTIESLFSTTEQQVAEAAPAEEAPAPTFDESAVGEYNPSEETRDKDMEALALVLNKKKIIPSAPPEITDLGDEVVFEYHNQEGQGIDKRLTFKKTKSGAITAKGVKIENNTGSIRGTDLFAKHVETKRQEFLANAEAVRLKEEQKRAKQDAKERQKFVAKNEKAEAKQREADAKLPFNELKGFNEVMDEVVNMRDKRRKGSYKEIVDNINSYVTNTNLYKNATDIQRENIMRHLSENLLREEQIQAPQADTLLGVNLNDTQTLAINLHDALTEQLRREEEVASQAEQVGFEKGQEQGKAEGLKEGLKQGKKETVAKISEVEKQIASDLATLVKNNVITPMQQAMIMKKFGNVSKLSERSIQAFANYVKNIIEDADYDNKLKQLRIDIKNAKKNVKTKLGTRISLANAVSSILAANPEIIPSSLKEKYERIVDIMASKSKVLATDDANAMLADANEIIKALQSQDESVLDLGIRFANFGNKIMNAKTGEVEYEKTIDDMLSKGEITSEEAELMRKFKKDINSSKLAEEVSKLADQREIELVKLSIDEIKKDLSVDNLAMREERDSAKKLIDGLSDEFINTLTVAEVKQLLNVLDNIANGIYTNTALQMQERAVAFKNSQTLTNAINESKPPTLSYLYAKLKSTFTNKTAVREMIRRVPLYYVSENLGIHSKVLYDTILKNVAKARAAYQVNFGIINKKLENAEVKLAKSFGNNINEFVKSKMKIYAYLVQNEFESNEGNDKLSSVDQHIQTTIDQINRGQSQSYTEAEAEILQGIADNPEYKNQDGSMSAKAMYEAMTPAEKRAIKEIQEVYASLQDKAIYTAAVVRGTPLELFNNYNHLNVSPDMNDVAIVDQTLNEIQNVQSAMNPSTKAKSLITRTRGPKALTFDPFLAASKSSKGILLDYFMTSPIRETRRLMNNVQADMNTTTEDGKFRNELFKGLNDSFEDVVNNVLVNMYTEDSFADRVAQEIKRTGYRAILTSVPRFVSELKSNVGFAVWNPQIFAQGIKLINSVDPHDIISVMLNSGSVNAERLYSSEELSGRMVDSSLLTQKSGLSRNKLRGAALNTAEQFYNNTIKKYKNSVEFVADTLIATPDKLVGRPVWIGAYATKFEEITGKKPDFKMIAENNEQYMEENKDAIEQATDFADRKSIETSASNNEFLGILKGTSTKQQGLLLQTFNQLNNFLSRFTIYEYQAARKSIYAMMGKGEISRAEGVKLLAAVVTRMTSYTLLSKILGGVMADLISKALGKDDDEDKKKKAEKSIKEQTKSAFTSTAIQLILGRDFGNAPRSIINWGIEKANEKYGQQMGLREGKYDPYKDQLGYSPIREGKKGRPKRSTDYLIDFSGAYAPSLQTANFIFDEYNNLSKKKKVTARDLYQLKYRVPLEVLGNAGFVPVYKDIRRAMFEMMPALPTKYQIKGVNKADLKRYFPDLYEQSYGESSSTYEAQQEKKAMDKERRDAIRQAKDEAYGYEGD